MTDQSAITLPISPTGLVLTSATCSPSVGMGSHQSASMGRDEWLTPPEILKALGDFDLDPCSPINRPWPTAAKHYTALDNGLLQTWNGRVWCNPPYSTPAGWAERMIQHGNGLMLTHVPINAAWAKDVWDAADGVRLFQAMEFVRPDGTLQRPGYWLMLAAFGEQATAALSRLAAPPDVAENPRRVPSPMWVRA